MGTTIKVTIDNTDDFQVRHRAQRMGLSVSEFCRRAIKKDLIGVVAEMPDAALDKVERGKGGRGVAAYLSPPIANAISQMAHENSRSASWIIRDLLRSELRRRGVLPTPNSETATADATA